MTIRYKYQRKGRIDPVYLCQHHRIERWESSCQYIPGASIDEAISKLLLESVAPLTVEEMMHKLTGIDINLCPGCHKGRMQLFLELPKGMARPPNPLAIEAA